jgi:hypothetical protein
MRSREQREGMSADGRTRLRKVDTVDEEYAVATYAASRDGVMLGTITKFDEPAYRTRKDGTNPRDYRLISWAHSRDVPHNGYDTRKDCLKALERAAGVRP